MVPHDLAGRHFDPPPAPPARLAARSVHLGRMRTPPFRPRAPPGPYPRQHSRMRLGRIRLVVRRLNIIKKETDENHYGKTCNRGRVVKSANERVVITVNTGTLNDR